jgi:hypothetical protein
MRSGQLRAGKKFSRPVIVKPPLAWFETCDDRVASRGMMFRRMLTGRAITTANMSALCASTKMKPPAVCRQAFDAAYATWLSAEVDTLSLSFHGCLQFHSYRA